MKEEAKMVSSGKVAALCFKCKKNRPNFTNKQDKVCRECFLDILVHRFRASLRQNLKIWKDDLNLICISGGSASMAMLNLLHYSLFGSQSNRKMFFRVHVLFIDEGSAVYGHNEEQRAASIAFVREVCSRYQFSYTIVPLEHVFDVDHSFDMRVADEVAA